MLLPEEYDESVLWKDEDDSSMTLCSKGVMKKMMIDYKREFGMKMEIG